MGHADMRIALLWNHRSPEEASLTKAVMACQRETLAKYFSEVFMVSLQASTVPATFAETFAFARHNAVAFSILSFGAGWVLSPERLKRLLDDSSVQEKALSVRMGMIQVKAGVFSPKLPYVDDNFLIVNQRRCETLGIIAAAERGSGGTHFERWGGVHAELMSFIEAVIPHGELFVYSNGSDCQDQYGAWSGFASLAYLYCDRYGLVCSDPSLDERVHALRVALLKYVAISDADVIDRYWKKYAGHVRALYGQPPFLQKPFMRRMIEPALEQAKRALGKINYEIKKKYHDTT